MTELESAANSPAVNRYDATKSRNGVLTRERLQVLLLLAATVVAIYLCWLIVSPFVPALAWVLALSIVAAPLHRWIAARLPYPGVAAGLTVALVAILIVGPTFLVTQRIASEATAFMQSLEPAKLNGQLRSTLENYPSLTPMLEWFDGNVDLPSEAQRIASATAPQLTSIVTGSTWIAFQFLITMFTLFYVLRDRHTIRQELRSLAPMSDQEWKEIGGRVSDTVYASVFGSVMVALIQGIMGGLMFWMLGLPSPVTWAFIMGLLALVPYLGTFVIWGPTAVILAFQGELGRAAILATWGLVAIGLVDNLVYPMLVGNRLRLHPLPVFFSILGGVSLFGASGLVLGPVVLAVTLAIFELWRRRTAHGQTAETPNGCPVATNSTPAGKILIAK